MACVQLINALVSTPDDLDFRLHLRNEFIREGMSEPFQVGIEFSLTGRHAFVAFMPLLS